MSQRLLTSFLILAFVAIGCESQPDDPAVTGDTAAAENGTMPFDPTGHADTTAGDWQSLFASDLSDAIDEAGVWSWQDGILTATEDEAIFTQEEYDDFILDLEVRFDPGANSGIIVHTSDTDDWIPNSLEIQIGDSYMPADSAQATGSGAAGSMYGHVGPSEQRIRPAGEWNRYTVYARGDSLWAVLNGALVSEIDMSEYTSAETNPDGSEIPGHLSTPLAELPTEGRIGLQGKHGESGVYFRNLKIRELN